MLKEKYPQMGIARLCKLFGKTRQAWYDRQKWFENRSMEQSLVLELVGEIRRDLPRLGLYKLHHELKPLLELHRINMGRHRLADLLRAHGLLVKPLRSRPRTTNSFHRFRKWPNLILGLEPQGPEQVLVSDITYLRTLEGFVYLSLVTDAFSRLIMGYFLNETLEAVGCIKAMDMAIKNRIHPDQTTIHHSDRGIQYCSDAYVELLQKNMVNISMTQSGEPTENPVAERVNGILKQEFDLGRVFPTYKSALGPVALAIRRYNYMRPHASCDFLKPIEAHQTFGKLKKRWKKKQSRKEPTR